MYIIMYKYSAFKINRKSFPNNIKNPIAPAQYGGQRRQAPQGPRRDEEGRGRLQGADHTERILLGRAQERVPVQVGKAVREGEAVHVQGHLQTGQGRDGRMDTPA